MLRESVRAEERRPKVQASIRNGKCAWREVEESGIMGDGEGNGKGKWECVCV